jgi:mono/diheme cytochrome c family protein
MLSVIAAVLGASLVLAACGGEGGGTTTIATAPGVQTTETGQTTTGAKQPTKAKQPMKAQPATNAKQPGKAEQQATEAEKTTTEAAKTEKEAAGVGKASVEEGEQVFASNACGGCHTLAAAKAAGTVGPNLDETLPGKSEAFIRESIVEPDAQIAPGYSAGMMPTTFGSSLSSSELASLVAFLSQSAGK